MPAIAFDVDDTLYDLAEPYRRAVHSFFGDRLDDELDELFRLSRIHSDEAFALVERGERPVEYMHIYRVQATFADFGIGVSESDAIAFQREYERMQGSIAMSDAVREVLRACVGSAWKVGVITNGESLHQRGKLEALGVTKIVPRENIVVSGDIGFSKPSHEVFRAAERKLGAGSSECWYVGDTYEADVAGALGAGWHCIWFNRRGRVLKAGEHQPDIEARSEAEMTSAVMGVVVRGA